MVLTLSYTAIPEINSKYVERKELSGSLLLT